MLGKKEREEILATRAGPQLDVYVESAVFGRTPCVCRSAPGPGMTCGSCNGTPVAQWSDSWRAVVALRDAVKGWGYYRRQRLLDCLGTVLGHRLKSGKVDPRQWLLEVLPEDLARAAVLAALDE